VNFLVRLDISKQIGTGHFRRIINLSNFMSEDDFIFLIKTDNQKNGIFNNISKFFLTEENEEEIIRDIISKIHIDLILLDLLHYSKDYIKNMKHLTDKKIVSFHEYQDSSTFSDLIINYNMFDNFEKRESQKFLAGPKYIIFDDSIDDKFICPKIDYVFVSFGGSDPSGLLEKFILQIATKLLYIEFYIHIGDFKELEGISLTDNIKILDKPKNLFKYMSGAVTAVTAAGNMMYELMYFEVPSFVISHNKHQDEFAKNAEKFDGIKYMGLHDNIDFTVLKNNIEFLFNEKNKDYKFNIDNLGKKRIANSIYGLIS